MRTNAPRVLWITPTVPGALRSGLAVYTGGLIGALAGAGAEVHVLGLRNPEGDGSSGGPFGEPDGPGLHWHVADRAARGVVPALASGLPLVAARNSPVEIRKTLETLLRDRPFDAVVFDNYGSGWALDIVDALAGAARRVYVAHNDETRLTADIARGFTGNPLRKVALTANAHKTRLLEQRLLRQADLLVTLTPEDRDTLSATHPVPARLVLPPGYAGWRREARRIEPGTPRRVLMLGSVRWIAKRMNTASFLAAADARFAEAGITLDLIGDIPDDFRAEWEPRVRATRFLGFVPDIREETARARFGLNVEETGGGFKLKTLDYVFHRLPVAALAGSCGGLPGDVRDHLMTRGTIADLVGAVIAAIDDLPRLETMQEKAFTAAERHFDWARNGRLLCDALAAPCQPHVRAA